MHQSSLTDIPRDSQQNEIDSFGIEPFENGLTEFIKYSNTPITIALQGEWGSGKTSLMNSLRKNLSSPTSQIYHGIWINTWEYALMKDASETLIDILSKLIKEVALQAGAKDEKRNKILKNLRKIGWSALKIASSMNSYTSAITQEIDENYLNNELDVSVSIVRDELQEIIDTSYENTGKGFIFFIDDLDRIDPPVAVELLELLKNIFTLNHCVFVLAIDYDVVIKGLEPKFGKYSEKNEREFRSFFDKIIQVPFSMPVNSYHIDNFLKESLIQIGYLEASQASTKELISNFSEVATLSVGSNPRSLKRLLNSLSLIKSINISKRNHDEHEELKSDLDLLLNFALVSTQIAYPQVYRLLASNPAFDEWNEAVALQANLQPLDEQSLNKLKSSQEFDEEWEQVLFRLCENDHYLKKRALYISRLLNLLKNEIMNSEENVEDSVRSVISLSAVTNVDAVEEEPINYNTSYLLKEIRERLFPTLKSKLPDNQKTIRQKGSKIVKNFRYHISEDGEYYMTAYNSGNDVELRMGTCIHFGEVENNFEQDLSKDNLTESFNSIISEYNAYAKENTQLRLTEIGQIDEYKGWYYFNINGYLKLHNPNDFYNEANSSIIASYILKLYETSNKLWQLAKSRNSNQS